MASELTGTTAGEPAVRTPSSRDPGLVLVFAPDLDAVPTVVPIPSGSTVLGREPPPGGITLGLSSLSRVHARLTRKGDAVVGDAIFVHEDDHASAYVGSRVDGSTDAPYPYAPVACGPVTRRLYDELVPIAGSDLTVLVHGETGTGKELVAQAVHSASGRGGPLRAINCAAIPAQLVESELFGFERGAFTGADRDSTGLVKSANGGTLFLDEIGDLPPEIQPKLLRLLESFEITPVGGARPERVDVRVVCATHADLEERSQDVQ